MAAIQQPLSHLSISVYGDIGEVYSRTSWEDWDEEKGCELPELKWENPLVIPEDVEVYHLLIFDGNCNLKITNCQKPLEKVNSIKEVNLDLYKTPCGVNYVCVLNNYDILRSNEVVKLLRNLIVKCVEVVVIQVKPVSDYLAAKPFEQLSGRQKMIVKQINIPNELHRVPDMHRKLEQPNMITGVAAGALIMREHLGLIAGVVVYYVENVKDQDIAGMQELLQKLNIAQTTKTTASSALNSNLYI